MWLNRNIHMERSVESLICNCAGATEQKGNARHFAVAIVVCSLFVLTGFLRNRMNTLEAQTPSTYSLAQKHQTATPITAKPPAVSGDSTIKFENAMKASRINFVLKNDVSPKRYSIETMTGGVALFDYNNDGLLDIFFTNGAEIPSLEKTNSSYSNRLFRNNGDGTFTDVTVEAGLAGIGYSMGVAAGDYDHDGFVDLYVTGVNYNQLFHNNGNGTFTDVTAKAGVSGVIPKYGKTWSVTAGWFDYNNDGLLDRLVINYLDYDLKTAAA